MGARMKWFKAMFYEFFPERKPPSAIDYSPIKRKESPEPWPARQLSGTGDRPVAACGKCQYLRTTGLHDDYCFAGGAGPIMCRQKNTDGICPDFKYRPPKFNYLTGEWAA